MKIKIIIKNQLAKKSGYNKCIWSNKRYILKLKHTSCKLFVKTNWEIENIKRIASLFIKWIINY